MPSHGFDKNFFFQHPKGGPFGFAKMVFAVLGGNFARKKILQNQKFLKYVQECPVKCLWLKSKIAQLSPNPTYVEYPLDKNLKFLLHGVAEVHSFSQTRIQKQITEIAFTS